MAPLGISGHYGLPVEGFIRAIEEGVNVFFWEPNYATLTQFASQLESSHRRKLHFLAGTFEAEPKAIRRDVERALRHLKLECLDLFLLFWTRSWARIDDDVLRVLESMKEKGMISLFSLSTHSRPLALEAMDQGWNPIMVRHSAAHRKAEQEILPKAVETGTSIITFNNTCYGRMMTLSPGEPPRPSDCYRYTLAQPGVTLCLSAPATMEELEENLNALRNPTLSFDQMQRLREQGDVVYREDTIFRQLVRAL